MSSAVREEQLDELRLAAERLPICDRSARLHALLARLIEVMPDPAQASTALDALASGTRDALADDPWFQFHTAVAALRAARDAEPR